MKEDNNNVPQISLDADRSTKDSETINESIAVNFKLTAGIQRDLLLMEDMGVITTTTDNLIITSISMTPTTLLHPNIKDSVHRLLTEIKCVGGAV